MKAWFVEILAFFTAFDPMDVAILTLFALVLIAAAAAGIVAYLKTAKRRRRKNETAQRIDDELNRMAAPPKAFFLYLRSFQADHQTTESWTLKTESGHVSRLSGATAKAALEALLEPAGPLIEIGGKRHLGLGQVMVSNADWWQSALRLIVHATAIFLNPGHTVSFQKEADLILSSPRLRRRSFLLMEPTHETMLDAAYEIDQVAAQDRSARWMETREFLLRHDIVVPDYDHRGAIISLASPERREPFRGISRYELYQLMHDLHVDLEKLGSYDLTRDEPCPCQSGRTFGKCHARRMVSQADLQAAQAAQAISDDAP
jgi:hypothetical protein